MLVKGNTVKGATPKPFSAQNASKRDRLLAELPEAPKSVLPARVAVYPVVMIVDRRGRIRRHCSWREHILPEDKKHQRAHKGATLPSHRNPLRENCPSLSLDAIYR